MKLTSLILLFILSPVQVLLCQEESPYELNSKKELIYGGTGFLLSAYGFIQRQRAEPLTVEEINELDVNAINSFDRGAINNNSDEARKVSDYMRNLALAMPLAFAIPKKTRNHFGVIGLMAMETLLLTNSVTSVFKNSAYRIRPFVYNQDVALEEKTTVQAKLSFFSGHTSNYAALSFFTAKVISDYSNNKRIKLLAYGTAATSSIYMGYLRVKAGRHFMTDVIVGNAIGAVVGLAIPQLHKKRKKETKLSFSPFYSGNTAGLNLTWKLN